MPKVPRSIQIVALVLGIILPLIALAAYIAARRVSPVLRVHAVAERLLRKQEPDAWEDRLKDGIARLGGPEAAAAKMDVYLHSVKPMEGSPDDHELIVVKMLGLCGKPATPVLHRLVAEGQPYLMTETFHSLERIADPRSCEIMCGALKDAQQPIRVYAARTLGRIADPRAVGPLLATIPTEKDVAVFMAVDEALMRIGAPAHDPLRKLLEAEGNPVIRSRIERILKGGGSQP